MKKEYDEKLVKKYSSLYRDRHADMRKTAMCWGFECGDGWYEIIDKLSAIIDPLGVVAHQVKEKFGTLSFYYGFIEERDDDTYKKVRDAVDDAERASAETCEVCGAPGKHGSDGWMSTLCETHWEERKERKERRKNNA